MVLDKAYCFENRYLNLPQALLIFLNQYQFFLVLNFPIYNGGYQSSKTKEARLKYKKARLEYTNSKRSLRKDLIDSLNAYNTNKKRYNNAKY